MRLPSRLTPAVSRGSSASLGPDAPRSPWLRDLPAQQSAPDALPHQRGTWCEAQNRTIRRPEFRKRLRYRRTKSDPSRQGSAGIEREAWPLSWTDGWNGSL